MYISPPPRPIFADYLPDACSPPAFTPYVTARRPLQASAINTPLARYAFRRFLAEFSRHDGYRLRVRRI
jgi:hypothetical protein